MELDWSHHLGLQEGREAGPLPTGASTPMCHMKSLLCSRVFKTLYKYLTTENLTIVS